MLCDPRRAAAAIAAVTALAAAAAVFKNNKSFVYAPSSSEALWRRADDTGLGSCIN